MRARKEPHLYQRGRIWWCYWRDERWSTKTEDLETARARVRERYDPRVETSRAKTIEDAIRLLYEALERRNRAPATKKIARQKMGWFANYWANKPLSEISFSTVLAYVAQRTEDDVSRLTISHELAHLRQAWKLAVAHGWTAKRWDEIMPERFDRKYVPRERWLTVEELNLVLHDLSDRRAAWVAWVVATGCDVGDVPRAQPGDVDFDRGLVRVRGSKNVFRDRKVAITPLNKPLLELALRFGPPFIKWKWCNLALTRCARRLGLPHFTPKDLRRTHGMWLRHAGVEPHLIGRTMGHADSAMADRVYAFGEAERIADLVRSRIEAVRMDRTNDVRTGVAHGAKGKHVTH
jgi:integrase